MLHEHVDDRNLEGTDDDYGTFTWKLEPLESTHQRFRLQMTKPAHDGDWYFAVSGVELYGVLVTKSELWDEPAPAEEPDARGLGLELSEPSEPSPQP